MSVAPKWDTSVSEFDLIAAGGSQLNALASGSLSAAGTEYNNTSGGLLVGRLHFHMDTSSIVLTAASLIQIYIVAPDLSGAKYPRITTGGTPKIAQQHLAATMPLPFITLSSQDLDEYFQMVTLPAGKSKTYLYSLVGSTLPATTANALSFIPTGIVYA